MEISGNIASLISLFILLSLSAFFSASETALTSISKIRVKHLVEENIPRAKTLDKIVEQPAKFLATILFMNNLVNIAAASLATVIVAQYFRFFVTGIATGIMTFLILVYGEITPKSFAIQNAEKIALWIAGPIANLSNLLFPIVRIFIAIANFFIKLLGGKTMTEGPFMTEEEMKTMVTLGKEEGVIEEEEKEMIHSIFEFGDTVAREVMVPRPDMVCVKSDSSLKKALSLIMQAGHSRLPVYQDNLDNIVGIIYAKDVLKYISEGQIDIELKKVMRPAHWVPETKKLAELLRDLQKRKVHIAIVVDEYGGTAGLVTIEDLLEEIVGEIFDEYDLEEIMVEHIDENNVRVDARVGIDEIDELFGISLPEFECDTIGGFVFSLFGRVPSEGEKIDFGQLTFTIEKVGGKRIKKILISKREPAQV